ncbi:hypothetical protein CsSME_00019537 [Camellia sinensis var. sinensis]
MSSSILFGRVFASDFQSVHSFSKLFLKDTTKSSWLHASIWLNTSFVTKEYLEELWQLALKIAGALSEDLGLDRDYIEKSLGEGCQIAAFNYYPPCPEPDRTLGLAAHSDHGGVIILMENDVAGLQVKHNHKWVFVPHVPGSFVVNIGDNTEVSL